MITCALSGERIDPKSAHMDHCYPMTFERLILDFLELKGINYENVETAPSSDTNPDPVIVDPELRTGFLAYHREYANLRMVRDTLNLEMGSKFRARTRR